MSKQPQQNDPGKIEDMPKKLPATTEVQQEANKAILDKIEEDERDESAPEHNSEDDGLDELPEGAVLSGAGGLGATQVDAVIAEATSPIRPRPQAAFDDDHVGKGGTYIVGDDGVRRPAYEAYQIKAPGKRGERGEVVTKYRRVV